MESNELKTEVEYEKDVRSLIDDFFKDTGTTERWMRTENPLLGGVSPYQMLKWGRGEKLLTFIKNQLAENRLPEPEKIEGVW